MNKAVGAQLTKDEIWPLIGNNYGEETEDVRVTLGFEIYEHMSRLREARLEFVGMSSVG